MFSQDSSRQIPHSDPAVAAGLGYQRETQRYSVGQSGRVSSEELRFYKEDQV